MRMSTVTPPAKVIVAVPPGRRSMLARSPNHAPRPSDVVSACHTSPGARVRVTVRSMRSGNDMTPPRVERLGTTAPMADWGTARLRRAVPWGPGSAILLGGAAGEVARAAVGGAGPALGQLPEAGTNEVIPAAAAHVLALEVVVQAAVLEGELARAVVERSDRERWLRSDPVLHEGALDDSPPDARGLGRLVDAYQQRRLTGHHREPQL